MRSDPVTSRINHSLGYGIVGFVSLKWSLTFPRSFLIFSFFSFLASHSMGGQATARSSVRANTYNIKAAVLLHPFSEVFEDLGKDIQVPLAGFTGTEDGCCGERSTRIYYDPAPVPKTLANMIGATHYEVSFLFSVCHSFIQ